MTDPTRTPEEMRKLCEGITKVWADQGKLIEGGWWAFATVMRVPEAQRTQMRTVFMAGAQHLFASITQIMEHDGELTAKELTRIELIHAELEAFARTLG